MVPASAMKVCFLIAVRRLSSAKIRHLFDNSKKIRDFLLKVLEFRIKYTFAATYSPRFPLEHRSQGESFLCLCTLVVRYNSSQSVSMSNNSNNLWQDFLGKDSSACPKKSSSWLLILASISSSFTRIGPLMFVKMNG